MRKAQIQMFETIFVVLIFIVFVGIGLIFYYVESKRNIDQKVGEFQSLGAIETTLIALNAPEFVCTSGEYMRNTCFDLQKVIAFESLRLRGSHYFSDYYFKQFGYSNITVTRIYPSPSLSWTLYSLSPDKSTQTNSFFVPVSLQDGSKIYLGVLKVVVMQG